MSGTRYVNRYGQHRLQAKGDDKNRDYVIEVIGGGNPYLWIGSNSGSATMTVSGKKTLRRLARAILDEVGDE